MSQTVERSAATWVPIAGGLIGYCVLGTTRVGLILGTNAPTVVYVLEKGSLPHHAYA
jgi:hypothetical protein